jgi:uncharacterized FlaG/YvyC family protein
MKKKALNIGENKDLVSKLINKLKSSITKEELFSEEINEEVKLLAEDIYYSLDIKVEDGIVSIEKK